MHYNGCPRRNDPGTTLCSCPGRPLEVRVLINDWATDKWVVNSEVDSDKAYLVATGAYTCTCPDFRFDRKSGSYCKHINAVIASGVK